MFRSQVTRRRHASVSTRGRRLGVELMEGRLMLSASGLDVPQPEVHAPQDAFAPALISWTDRQYSLTTQPTDGGFIQADVTWRMTRPSRSVTFSATTDSNISISEIFADYQLSFNSAGQGMALSDSAIESGGLQPVVFGNSGNDVVLEPTIRPIVAGPPASKPGPSEGGSIPIHAILADLHESMNLASEVKSIRSMGTEKSVAPQLSARSLSMSDNAMSGEWARAMVFEIAGGEPGTGESHSLRRDGGATTSSDKTPQRDEPLSSVETQQPGEKLAGSPSAASSNVGQRGVQPGQLQAGETYGPIIAALTPGNSSQLLTGSQLSNAVGQATGNSALGVDNPDAAALASAAVFDRLGEENGAIVESSVDRGSWFRLVGAMPLLMVLALERIAAINSRRATRESRIAAAKKSLRLPC